MKRINIKQEDTSNQQGTIVGRDLKGKRCETSKVDAVLSCSVSCHALSFLLRQSQEKGKRRMDEAEGKDEEARGLTAGRERGRS